MRRLANIFAVWLVCIVAAIAPVRAQSSTAALCRPQHPLQADFVAKLVTATVAAGQCPWIVANSGLSADLCSCLKKLRSDVAARTLRADADAKARTALSWAGLGGLSFEPRRSAPVPRMDWAATMTLTAETAIAAGLIGAIAYLWLLSRARRFRSERAVAAYNEQQEAEAKAQVDADTASAPIAEQVAVAHETPPVPFGGAPAASPTAGDGSSTTVGAMADSPMAQDRIGASPEAAPEPVPPQAPAMDIRGPVPVRPEGRFAANDSYFLLHELYSAYQIADRETAARHAAMDIFGAKAAGSAEERGESIVRAWQSVTDPIIMEAANKPAETPAAAFGLWEALAEKLDGSTLWVVTGSRFTSDCRTPDGIRGNGREDERVSAVLAPGLHSTRGLAPVTVLTQRRD